MAILRVKAGEEEAFERDFLKAEKYIASVPGYLGHTLQKCIEVDGQYLLLASWRKLSDHTIGFRTSVQYQDWKRLLHHYYSPFPTVEHYKSISGSIKLEQ